MDKKQLEKHLKQLTSGDEAGGVAGLQNLFSVAGASLEEAIRYAADRVADFAAVKTVDHQPAKKAAVPAGVNMSGVPDCRGKSGSVEIVLAGKEKGDVYVLPGEAARDAENIALHFKDAIVAAVINKSRFKLKLVDVKNGKGEVVETVLQAEYERAGMIPIRVWVNSRGEVGALAAVLRKAVANSLPELAA